MSLCILVARITIETGGVEGVCIICHMAVVARVDTRFDSSTFLRLFTFSHTFFHFHSFTFLCDDCVECDSTSLSRWRKETYRRT